MKHLCFSPFLALGLLAASIQRSDACGSASWTLYRAIAPAQESLSYITEIPRWSGGWDELDRPEYRFLYPARAARPKELNRLWEYFYAYGGTAAEDASSLLVTEPFTRAVASGMPAATYSAAQRLIDGYLALPPEQATPFRGAFWHAVGALELQSALASKERSVFDAALGGSDEAQLDALEGCLLLGPGGGPPGSKPQDLSAGSPQWCALRAGSVEFLRLQRRTAREIPDGWSSDGEQNGQREPARALLVAMEEWRERFANHPLADLASLWQVRVQHFAGETDASWEIFAEVYPRRPVRVLAEIRYLLLTVGWPELSVLDAFPHPEVVVGLLTIDGLVEHPERQERWWRWSQQHLPAAWAINLQERLLTAVARRPATDPLPGWFPGKAGHPSELWGKLRAGLLLMRGHLREAEEQAALLMPDEEQAGLLAAARLQQGRPLQAVTTPSLDASSAQLILCGWLGEEGLRSLLEHPSAELAGLARVELAQRRVMAEDYAGAANLLRAAAPERAAVLDRAGRAAAQGELLTLARELATNGWYPEPGDYRGMSGHYAVGTRRGSGVAACMVHDDLRWLALGLFTRWLQSHYGDASAPDVLREADAVYNSLINYGGGAYFWNDFAPGSVLVRRLRSVGRVVRRAQGS